MHEVEVSRFVRATPAEVQRALTPAALVEYEGSFSVVDVDEQDDGTTVVTAGSRGLSLALRFQELADGLSYTQEGEAGPFDEMETRVSVTAEDDGARVTMWSAVSLGLPLSSLTDRLAAWKRKGELKRALDALATDLR
ncbi:Polyketide cyclase / dehydrase and lipid transport [Halogranum rubrum]|uniref:Polyketide cyclase / dehydrase and lipid transport n=2 Tax=Halogranum rubrum TaxID=553466 RepID=A0A1I4HAD8_9EURY|nr:MULTISPECIES: SRPBCC family protein [Halogranum]EJN60004.1 hypothetical protein HSB1_21620 [Halogranum salarium B-1]SFL38750.1 Polyketide cyclase / dehydrase and lipid transport [Halogranum rubrum]